MGKVVGLLAARQCNLAMFRDIYHSLSDVVTMLAHHARNQAAGSQGNRADGASDSCSYAPLLGLFLLRRDAEPASLASLASI